MRVAPIWSAAYRNAKKPVYIGRPGRGIPPSKAKFGNPIIRGKTCPVCGQIHREPGDTLHCYWKYLTSNPDLQKRILALDPDSTLGCFCKDPTKCHGSMIIRFYELNRTEQPDPDEDPLMEYIRKIKARRNA